MAIVAVAGLVAGSANRVTAPLGNRAARHDAVEDSDPAYKAICGWGPGDRATFTMHNPSPYVTLNSITDNPDMGDERNFFRVKPADSPKHIHMFGDDLRIVGRHRYTAEVFFSNSASPTGASTTNARVQLLFPATIKGSGVIRGIVRANNSSPPAVWDSAVLTLPSADEGVALYLVPGSARIHTEGETNGSPVNIDELTSAEGARVGCDRLDGVLSGEGRCEGWLTVDFVTAQANFIVDAALSDGSAGDLARDKTISPNETVTVRMMYQNTGNIQLDNVVLSLAARPRCSTVVPGSTFFTNDRGEWVKASRDIDINSALNVGSYGPNGGMYLKFDLHFCDLELLDREYLHDFAKGSLWTDPNLSVKAETDAGYKVFNSLLIVVQGPNQPKDSGH